MTTHNMLQVSDNVEYGTPLEILECVHEMLGFISLDPASNHIWNKNVKSLNIFTESDNGLTKRWYGNVWLNHPFRRTERSCKPNCTKKTCEKREYHITKDILGNEYWIAKLISEYENHNIASALNICYAATSEQWYKPLLKYPTCFINNDGRTNYIDVNGEVVKGVQKGSSITYFGSNYPKFKSIFSKLGDVLRP